MQLRQFIEVRFDPRLAARVDPSDVVQEVQAEMHARLDDYLRHRPFSLRLWMLKTALDRLGKLHRQHVSAVCRSVRQEVPLSVELAARLSASSTPSDLLSRAELVQQVRRAMARLAESDRQVLLLRHVDRLNNQEIGLLLELHSDAVSKRHGRALLRLRMALSDEGLGSEDL
jgi:RNA polymerase sigma-70 factor (ECF subfamily)